MRKNKTKSGLLKCPHDVLLKLQECLKHPHKLCWPVWSSHKKPCCCLVTQSVAQTLCDPTSCSLPGSSVHGIFQARILEWVVTPTSRGSSWPRDVTCVSYLSWIGSRFFTTSTGSPTICLWKWKVLVAQLCPTLYDPIDYSLPGSSVHRILQAKILEWVAIPPSPGDLHNPGIIAGGF